MIKRTIRAWHLIMIIRVAPSMGTSFSACEKAHSRSRLHKEKKSNETQEPDPRRGEETKSAPCTVVREFDGDCDGDC